jgi:hypothetical protein
MLSLGSTRENNDKPIKLCELRITLHGTESSLVLNNGRSSDKLFRCLLTQYLQSFIKTNNLITENEKFNP